MPSRSREHPEERGAEQQLEPRAEEGREEERGKLLAVVGAGPALQQLALVQPVEDAVETRPERLAVGGAVVLAAGHLGDLLEECRVDRDLQIPVARVSEEV